MGFVVKKGWLEDEDLPVLVFPILFLDVAEVCCFGNVVVVVCSNVFILLQVKNSLRTTTATTEENIHRLLLHTHFFWPA
jgi:hypothetical protein